jgi:sugar lactone lactonase YvrE
MEPIFILQIYIMTLSGRYSDTISRESRLLIPTPSPGFIIYQMIGNSGKREIAMRKTSRYMFLSLIVLLLTTVLACSSSSPTGQGDNTTSVTVSIDVQPPPQARSKTAQKFIGTWADVTSLTVDVLNGGTSIIPSQHLTYSNGVWSGTLPNLPIGPSLTFVGHAYNASAFQIFTGTTIQAMTGNGDSVSVLMAPVSDGISAMFPQITKILVPAKINTSSTLTVSIWLEASSGETLTYAATAAPGGGIFSSSSGTTALGGTTGTLVLNYTAPSTAGTYTHSVRIINSQTNWVEMDFCTVVVISETQMGGAIQGSSLNLTAAVTTLAGIAGSSGSTDGTGAAVRFNFPFGMTADGTNLYVVDSSNHTIRKIVISTGEVTTLAGTAGYQGSADGTGAAARFYYPYGITTDGTNLYVADSGNNTIRKIVISTGAVTTLAGTAQSVGSSDGNGAVARFNNPFGITTDGTNLYVADSWNHTIRKIVISTGEVTTLAGTAGYQGSTDGTGAAARFYYPYGITTDGTNLYIADTSNCTIRKIVISTGEVTTLAGTAGLGGSTDGTGAAARFYLPYGITTDGTNLYVADSVNQLIRKIVISTGEVTTLAGTAGASGSADGTGAAARFNYPYGITTDGTNLYVADSGNNTIRKIQ